MPTQEFDVRSFILGPDGQPKEVTTEEHSRWLTQVHGGRFPSVGDDRLDGGRVLTQFIGTDPRGGGRRLFQTSIVGGDYHGYTRRWSHLDEAERGHRHVTFQAEGWILGEMPAEFLHPPTGENLELWGFCQTDEGSEWEQDLRGCGQVPGMDGLSLVVRPDDGATCLVEFREDGRETAIIPLSNQKTIGGVMRIVAALRHRKENA